MNITDLSETIVHFELTPTHSECELWDYNFYASLHGEHEYMQSLSRTELFVLRENCKNILQLTNNLEIN